jgi:hypothetical protein
MSEMLNKFNASEAKPFKKEAQVPKLSCRSHSQSNWLEDD